MTVRRVCATLNRNAVMVAIEPVEDVSRFVGAAADLREQQLAFLRVMEALGNAWK